MRAESRRELPVTVETERPSATGRLYGDLLVHQLHGIQAWNRYRRDRQQVLLAAELSREGRLDAARAREALDRTHASLVGHLDQALAADVDTLRMPGPRAVLVHRQEWFAEKMTQALSELGVLVVAACDNGADALGILIAEQPDLVLVEESLPMATGEAVLTDAWRFCPATALVAQAASGDRIGDFLDAGARIAVTRQVPPADLAAQMFDLLRRAE